MTSGLQRGSNVDANVDKFMVIPFDRLKQFNQKLKSPMFSERFIKDNWKIIFFEILIEEYNKTKNKTKVVAPSIVSLLLPSIVMSFVLLMPFLID